MTKKLSYLLVLLTIFGTTLLSCSPKIVTGPITEIPLGKTTPSPEPIPIFGISH